MLKFIPNAITLANLLCGCVAIIYVLNGEVSVAFFWVLLGLLFDFMDGMVARLLRVTSDLGKELDSLADVVTFGVVPGLVMMQKLDEVFQLQHAKAHSEVTGLISFETPWMVYIGLLIALASAYRLAHFNTDTRQTTSFIGLPTPANALMIMGFALINPETVMAGLTTLLLTPWFWIVLTLLSCFLLNAPLPLFSFKFKTLHFQENKLQYLFLVVSIVLLALFKITALPFVILLYVLVSSLFYKNPLPK
jgi:CDP-diacylglycerol--serine O-phosphatidyltransferase